MINFGLKHFDLLLSFITKQIIDAYRHLYAFRISEVETLKHYRLTK